MRHERTARGSALLLGCVAFGGGWRGDPASASGCPDQPGGGAVARDHALRQPTSSVRAPAPRTCSTRLRVGIPVRRSIV
jgi:hypothetical protein